LNIWSSAGARSENKVRINQRENIRKEERNKHENLESTKKRKKNQQTQTGNGMVTIKCMKISF